MRLIAPALVFVAVITLAVACSSDERAAPAVVEGQGDITSAVEEYRALLGPDNGSEPVSASTGRREINWDGVDDAEAAPNDYDPELFNSETAPRARGIVLSSSGPIQISADADNPTGTAPRLHLRRTASHQLTPGTRACGQSNPREACRVAVEWGQRPVYLERRVETTPRSVKAWAQRDVEWVAHVGGMRERRVSR